MKDAKPLKTIQSEWESTWALFERVLDPIIRSGQQVDIARLMDVWAYNVSTENKVFDDVIERNCVDRGLPRDPSGQPFQSLMVLDGQYVSVPRKYRTEPLLVDAVISAMTEKTRVIVELGSGMDRNLFSIYYATVSSPLRFVACELGHVPIKGIHKRPVM